MVRYPTNLVLQSVCYAIHKDKFLFGINKYKFNFFIFSLLIKTERFKFLIFISFFTEYVKDMF